MNGPFTDRDVINQLTRTDLGFFTRRVFKTLNPDEPFINSWHVGAMTHLLDEARRGAVRRALVTVPPRHLKSILNSVAFPAFVLGLDPSQKFLVASYGGELAAKLARDFRTVVESDWYRSAFPGMRRFRRNVDGDLITTLGGGRKAISLGGATTGFGADYIIVDDLTKALDAGSQAARDEAKAYFRGSLMSRTNIPTEARVIVIAQRLHEDDIPGYCLETGLYTHLNLPAIAEERQIIPLGDGRTKIREIGDIIFPERNTRASLEEKRLELGPTEFSAQYLQNPTPAESNLIRFEEIQRYEIAPPREKLEKVIQSWDTASTESPGSDYSVCTTWGYYRKARHLLSLYREKHEYPQLIANVRRLRDSWRADIVLVEKAGSGIPVLSDLRAEQAMHDGRTPLFWTPIAYKPKVEKVIRFSAQTVKLQSGFALFPEAADFMHDLKREMTAFPKGRHDDQVDSIAQFLDYAGKHPVRPENWRPA